MGCISSKNIEDPTAAPPPISAQSAYVQPIYTEPVQATVVIPATSNKKTKGGILSYPGAGARRQVNSPYVPNPSDFTQIDRDTAVATKHFVSAGGGNALVLVDGLPPSQPQPGVKFIEVIVPEGLKPGQVINVSSGQDGSLFACTVPDGMTAGSKFIVEVQNTKQQSTAPPAKAIPY